MKSLQLRRQYHRMAEVGKYLSKPHRRLHLWVIEVINFLFIFFFIINSCTSGQLLPVLLTLLHMSMKVWLLILAEHQPLPG